MTAFRGMADEYHPSLGSGATVTVCHAPVMGSTTKGFRDGVSGVGCDLRYPAIDLMLSSFKMRTGRD